MSTVEVYKTGVVIEVLSPEAMLRTEQEHRLRTIDTVLEFGLLVLLVAAVLAFGAVRPWGVFGLRFGAAILFAIWAARAVIAQELEIAISFVPLLLLGGWITFQWALGISAYRYVTGQQALTALSWLLLMFPTVTIAKQPRRLQRFLTALAVFGTVLALFAMIQDVSGTKAIYWLMQPSGMAVQIYGPYVNRNHYAGLMEMLTPLPFLLCMGQRPEKRLPYIAAGLLMALSIFLCRSRGGMLALGAEFVLITVFLSHTRHRARSFAAVAAVAAALVALVVWVGSDPVVHRLTDMKDASRLAIFKDTVHMWLARPLTGHGLGNFELVFPTYQSFVVDILINHVHNDYLELLSETGLIGIGLILWFLINVYRTANQKLSSGVRSGDSAAQLAVLAGITGLFTHSFVDFNFHIPANAAVFLVFCAIALTNRDTRSSSAMEATGRH